MNLTMDVGVAKQYRSKSQQARVVTETWAQMNAPCPGCGGNLGRYANNSPVADFYCLACLEDFELKATAGKIGRSIPDGAYTTMLERLVSHKNPNLLLMQYDAKIWSVDNMIAIPKYFFSSNIIQKRLPLSSTSRQAGWTGCNIIVGDIPSAGKIPIVVDRIAMPLENILFKWRKTNFLQETRNDEAKGWLLKTMSCIDHIGKTQFELNDIYRFESVLSKTYPKNRHIKEKLRQQLQILRDRGYVRFLKRGVYELT